MTELPAPLSPPDCDLRGLEWFPLYGDRLFGSDTWLMASPEGRCAALALWWASWKQCPAGSLPDHDRALAQLAGYGAAVKAWMEVREEVMRGWVRCSDGRLYHPVVCSLAAEAWDRRRKERERKAGLRSRKGGTDAGQESDVHPPVPRTGRGTDAGQDADDPRNGHGNSAAEDAAVRVDRTVQERKEKEDDGDASCAGACVATAVPSEATTDPPTLAPKPALRLVERPADPKPTWDDDPPPFVRLIAVFDAALVGAFGAQAGRFPHSTDGVTAERWLKAAVDAGIPEEEFIRLAAGAMAATHAKLAGSGRQPPFSLSFHDRDIANVIAARNRPMPVGSALSPVTGRGPPPREGVGTRLIRELGLGADLDAEFSEHAGVLT